MEILLSLIGFSLGAVLGSFVKALSDRTCKKISFWGRSYCESCQKTLSWYDLFPIFSYLWLKGKCRYCHHKIPLDNFLTEVSLGILAAVIIVTSLPPLDNLLTLPVLPLIYSLLGVTFKLFVLVILAIVFLTDLKTGLIFDRITYPAIVITGFFILISNGLKSYLFYQDINSSPLGKYLMLPYSNYFIDALKRIWEAALYDIGAGVLSALFFILLIISTRGKGMGWGDVKYVLFLGLALGFPGIIAGLFFSFLIGALVSIILVAFKRKSFKQTVPFGPFLSIGGFIGMLWGEQIINLYINKF